MQPYQQTLNSMDQFEIGVHRLLRSIGQPGLKLHLHLWLAQPVDTGALEAALARLVRLYPVAAGRLVHSRGLSRWRTAPGAACPLQIVSLNSDDEQAVWTRTEQLMAEGLEPETQPPLSFHLLRRPCRGDVLVVEWVHSLMDGKAGELVLREVNRLQGDRDGGDGPVAPATDNEIRSHIRSFSLRKRWLAVRGVLRQRLRDAPVLLMGAEHLGDWVAGPMRLAGRLLDERQTAAVAERSRRLCGFENLTPPILASTYRALKRHTPNGGDAGRLYHAPVPVGLRPPGAREPIFRNLVTYVGLQAREDELEDRDELTRTLSRRMRQQFAERKDLGSMVFMSNVARFNTMVERRLRKRPRAKISLGYAYHGEMPSDMETFCGASVEREFFITSLPAPPGLGISANRCRGRLNLSMVYIQSVIPDELAHRFLDSLLDDLTTNGSH